MKIRHVHLSLLATLILCGTLAACATPPTDPEDRAEWAAVNDPLEPTNRAIFSFNTTLDDYFLAPLARGYRAITPDMVQLGVHNVLANMESPWIFINDALQGQGTRAAETLNRFVINSTVGIGGIFDVIADGNGPTHHDEDFGQTLAVWGVDEGPYLMLPFLGPSNPRDGVGLITEYFADPTDIVFADNDLDWLVWTRLGMTVIDERTQLLDPLDDLKRSSLDYYAAVRSVYRQRRAALIANKDTPLGSIIQQDSK